MKIQLIKIYMNFLNLIMFLILRIKNLFYHILKILNIDDEYIIKVDQCFMNFFNRILNIHINFDIKYIYNNDEKAYNKALLIKADIIFTGFVKMIENHHERAKEDFLYWLWAKHKYLIIRIVLCILMSIYILNFII